MFLVHLYGKEIGVIAPLSSLLCVLSLSSVILIYFLICLYILVVQVRVIGVPLGKVSFSRKVTTKNKTILECLEFMLYIIEQASELSDSTYPSSD